MANNNNFIFINKKLQLSPPHPPPLPPTTTLPLKSKTDLQAGAKKEIWILTV